MTSLVLAFNSQRTHTYSHRGDAGINNLNTVPRFTTQLRVSHLLVMHFFVHLREGGREPIKPT